MRVLRRNFRRFWAIPQSDIIQRTSGGREYHHGLDVGLECANPKVDKPKMNALKAMGMGGISRSQVSRLCEEIDGKVKAFLERPIEGDWPYLWISAVGYGEQGIFILTDTSAENITNFPFGPEIYATKSLILRSVSFISFTASGRSGLFIGPPN